jgi:GNAT superfamily N-acetyltransferase
MCGNVPRMKPSIQIRIQPTDDLLASPQFMDVVRAYAEGCGNPVICNKPDPRIDQYRALAATGLFHVVGAYVDDTLVGLATLLMHHSLHYGTLTAIIESLYVQPAYRRYGTGVKLLHTAERLAKDLGASAILLAAPVNGPLERVAPAIGYHKTHTYLAKPL